MVVRATRDEILRGRAASGQSIESSSIFTKRRAVSAQASSGINRRRHQLRGLPGGVFNSAVRLPAASSLRSARQRPHQRDRLGGVFISVARGEISLRLANTESLLQEFESVQLEIESYLEEDEISDDELEQFQTRYYSIVALAKHLSQDDAESSKSSHHSSSSFKSLPKNNYANNAVKLPTISLPSFDGSVENWLDCPVCTGNHPLYSCSDFLRLSATERLKVLNDKHLCVNCMRTGHGADACWFGPCKQPNCDLKHNSLVHGAETSRDRAEKTTGENSTHTSLHSAYQGKITADKPGLPILKPSLLSTALVDVADSRNCLHTIRCVLDNGSQRCIVSESLIKKLDLNLIQSTHKITGVGQTVTSSSHICELKLHSKTSNFNTNLTCLVLPSITSDLSTSFDLHSIHIPDNIQLADPEFYRPDDVQLLIGVDKFWELINDGKIRLNKDGPYLVNTKLGWIVAGTAPSTKYTRINEVHCNFTQTSDAQMRMFWELEEIPKPGVHYTKDEQACEDLFIKTTTRDEQGRFSVRIPLKESPDVIDVNMKKNIHCASGWWVVLLTATLAVSVLASDQEVKLFSSSVQNILTSSTLQWKSFRRDKMSSYVSGAYTGSEGQLINLWLFRYVLHGFTFVFSWFSEVSLAMILPWYYQWCIGPSQDFTMGFTYLMLCITFVTLILDNKNTETATENLKKQCWSESCQYRLATGGGGPCPDANINPDVAEIAPALLVEIPGH
ncbi:putative peptidase (DUF1758) domain-containing protein [Phthorimaea operculella]|nr:putative peptidase (DUF1758) domain-containing protein [Phthorimaea operculella]